METVLGDHILSNDISNANTLTDNMRNMYKDWLPEHHKPVEQPQIVQAQVVEQAPVSTAPTFNTVLEEWQKQWSLTTRMFNERTKFYKWFTHYLGDMPVDTITRKTLNGMFSQLRNFPKIKLGSPYYKMSVDQLIEVAESEELTPEECQGANLRNGWKHLSPFFTFCVEQEYLDDAPKLSIKLEPTTRRGCFSLTQMKQIVSYHCKGKKTLENWAALLQIYTGARNKEILQLRKEDVKRDEDSGVLYIRISEKAGTVKTKLSNRNTPVHQALLDMGFKQWIDKQKDGRLFPENLSLTLVYKEAKAALGLPDTDIDDLQLSAYSARHRLNTSLVEIGIHDLAIKAITGHSAGSTRGNMTAHYSHVKNLAALKEAIDKVVY